MPDKRNGVAGRLLLLYVVIAAVSAVLAARLYQLQIVDGERYRLMADQNRLRLVEDSAPRGVIFKNPRPCLSTSRAMVKYVFAQPIRLSITRCLPLGKIAEASSSERLNCFTSSSVISLITWTWPSASRF